MSVKGTKEGGQAATEAWPSQSGFRLIVGLGLLLVTGVFVVVVSVARGKAKVTASTPASLIETMKKDVAFLASDECGGRDNGTPGHEMAQRYLIDQLEEFAVGLDSSLHGEEAFWFNSSFGTQNILAIIKGKELPDEYVFLGSHYDHVSDCRQIGSADSDVCNGASDNAAGMAAVLGIGRSIANMPIPLKRSVVLAFWDSEEDGLMGSKAFTDNPLVPLESIAAYLNYDVVGSNLLPSLKNVTFAMAAESGGTALQEALGLSSIDSKLTLLALSEAFGQGRSDHKNFIDAGVPSVFFTSATNGCYHTSGDEIKNLDFQKLEEEALFGLNLAMDLGNAETKPVFSRAEGPVTFNDTVNLNGMTSQLSAADLELFGEYDRSLIVSNMNAINRIVEDGPDEFAFDDVMIVAQGTQHLVQLMTSALPCNGYL